MTDADPFLEAIWANPADDLPRLVYADWLEEQGQATYAEFIRLDCALERMEPTVPKERDRLRHRRHELRTRLANEWAHILGDDDRWVLFWSRRGLFAPEPVVDTDVFLKCSPKWWPWIPIRSVTLMSPNGYERELASAGYLSRLRVLRVGRNAGTWFDDLIPDTVLMHLARANHLDRLDALAAGPVRASRASLQALASATYLPQLGHDGLFIRVVFGVPDEDGSFEEHADIKSPPGLARQAIEAFIEEYGDRLAGEG